MFVFSSAMMSYVFGVTYASFYLLFFVPQKVQNIVDFNEVPSEENMPLVGDHIVFSVLMLFFSNHHQSNKFSA